MTHNLDLLLTLSAGFIAALGLGYFTHRLGWSPIVGYLLAGILVGPHTPGFVANPELAGQLAEVGVILLMFGVGLHFHLEDLIAVRRAAITGALGQIAVATALGAVLAHLFGWTWPAGLVFGLALSVASTVVLTRVLSDNDQLRSPVGRIAIGWLIVEDIFTVLALVLLPALFGGAPDQKANLPIALTLAVVKLAAFVAFMLFAGGRLVPRLLNAAAATRSRELFTLSVMAVAVGIAVASAQFFGVSVALGAFMAGMVVGRSDFSARAAAEALPMRDAFAVMFFLSVGMLFNPRQVLEEPLFLAATLAIVLFGKPLAAFGIMTILGYSSRAGLGVSIALAQIGEFSFLVAALATDLKVLPERAMNLLVASAIATIMLNPILYRRGDGMESVLTRVPWLWRLLNRKLTVPGESAGRPRDSAHHAIVVGHGPIGRAVTRLLRERGIEPTVIEMNIDTFRALKADGTRVVYGDSNQREVLERAGVAQAGSLILSTSGAAGTVEAIRNAREINPRIHVVSRADYLAQTPSLVSAGADEVFSGEGEVAFAITDAILRRLGATPAQMDEERLRIRTDLFPG